MTEPADSSHETEHYVTPHDMQHISGRREPIGILRMGEGCGAPQTFSPLRSTTGLASHPHFVLFLPVFLPFFRHYGALSQGRHFYSPRSALNILSESLAQARSKDDTVPSLFQDITTPGAGGDSVYERGGDARLA